MLAAQPDLALFMGVFPPYCALVDCVSPPVCLTVVKRGVLAGKVDWLPQDSDFVNLQTIHASPSLWSKPWFDSDSVQGDGEVRYAELLTLFRGKGLPPSAFVKWYVVDALPDPDSADIFVRCGCTRLKWQGADNVIELQSILARQYVVPYLCAVADEEHFYVSVFKWDWAPVGFVDASAAAAALLAEEGV